MSKWIQQRNAWFWFMTGPYGRRIRARVDWWAHERTYTVEIGEIVSGFERWVHVGGYYSSLEEAQEFALASLIENELEATCGPGGI